MDTDSNTSPMAQTGAETQTLAGATENFVFINTKKPLLQFVKKITKNKKKNNGGSEDWECNLCGHHFKGSYTRVYHHLLSIPGDGVKACTCSLEKRIELTKLHMDAIGDIVEMEDENYFVLKKPRILSIEEEYPQI